MNKIRGIFEKVVNHKLFLITVVIVCLYTQGRQSDKYFGWSNPNNTLAEHQLTIHTDGAGYYAYLPQWYIYSDQPGFRFLEDISQKYNTSSFINGIGYDHEKHKGTDKYYIGTAVCNTPFFLTNHLIQKTVYGSGDGYSKSYQFTVSIAALFYWLLGIIGLIKLLKKFNSSNFSIALIIGMISLGTNLNFYTTYFPSFSHTYSFCSITWFLYFGICWAQTRNTNYFILLGFSLGMIFIIRPTNALVVLMIPFLFENWKQFTSELSAIFSTKKRSMLLAFSLFAILIFLQVYIIHLQTGKWALNTYTTEGFDFLTNPKIPEILFGFEKGFFIYAPVMLILIPSLPFLLKKGKYFSVGWSLVFLILVYLTASWWCWWYGGGLGMRPFIDFLGFLALPIALFLNHITPWIKGIVFVFTISMISFYQVLQIQFNLNIIHYDKMTQENYWKIFLRTDERYSWMLHFKDDHIPQNKIQTYDRYYFDQYTWNQIKPGAEAFTIKADMPDIAFTYHPDSTYKNSFIGVRVQGEMRISDPNSNPSFVINFYRNGAIIKKSEQYIGNTLDELNKLLPFSKDCASKISYSRIDSIGIYMTKGAPPTVIKNLRYSFYRLK